MKDMTESSVYFRLRQSLLDHGHEAVVDFVGYDFPSDESVLDTRNRIANAFMRFSVNTIDYYCRKYGVS